MAGNENFLQNSSQTAGVNPLNEEQKIQEILQEQQKLQALYNQVVVYIQGHPNMTSDEMLKYQAQLKQLSEYYQKNQEKLKLLGYSNLQVNKDVVIKSWATRNISVKSIFIWCGAIIFFLVIGLLFLFYYLVQNPAQLSGLGSLGISPSTAKSLLSGLSLTVMIVIMLVGIIVIIMNVYKSFTVKNKPKAWYYGGIFIGVFVLGLALGAGTKLLGEIWKIQVDALANPDEVLLSYVHQPTKDNSTQLTQINKNSILIAPVNVPFKLLTQNFKTYIALQIWNYTPQTVQLDCGNGQILNYGGNDMFNGACFYTKKGNYTTSLIVGYTDAQNVQQTWTYPIKTLTIASELSFSVPEDKKLEMQNNEVIVWPLPVWLTINADQVFRDLGLKNYRISWDGDGDGNEDKADDTSFIFNYEKAEVYYPSFTLPDLGKSALFSFPLRVEKSLTPVCKFSFDQKKVNDYVVNVEFLDGGERNISDYSYLVMDHATNQVLDELQGKTYGMSFNYKFQGQGSYLFRMNFITNEGKRGSCEDIVRLTDKASYTVNYELSSSTPRVSSFQKLNTTQIQETKTITLSEVPTKLKFRIQSIEPKTYDSVVRMLYDGRPVVETNTDEYLFDVRDSKEHTITLQIEDKVRGLQYQETLTTKIWLDDIVGDIKVIGEKSGFSPFTTTLDASATKLNDPDDEIAYFSWDFWDGKTQNNLSNAVIKHTYYYNVEKNQWTFKPKVSVFTKKGRSLTFGLEDPIIVNKQLIKLDISSTSHPTQEARLGEPVVFSLDFNGLPEKIYWSFGDESQPLSCNGRECIEMTKTFDKKWTYTIKVTMEFEDEQTVEQSMTFRVR